MKIKENTLLAAVEAKRGSQTTVLDVLDVAFKKIMTPKGAINANPN